MVEEDVAVAQGGEDVRRGRRLHLGEVTVSADDELGVLELGPVQRSYAEEAGQVQRAGQRIDLGVGDLQLLDEQVEHGRVDGLLDLQAHRGPEAPPHQLLLQGLEEVLRVVLLDLQVLVAVTRNMWCARTSMPGNSSSRWAAMTSSMGT